LHCIPYGQAYCTSRDIITINFVFGYNLSLTLLLLTQLSLNTQSFCLKCQIAKWIDSRPRRIFRANFKIRIASIGGAGPTLNDGGFKGGHSKLAFLIHFHYSNEKKNSDVKSFEKIPFRLSHIVLLWIICYINYIYSCSTQWFISLTEMIANVQFCKLFLWQFVYFQGRILAISDNRYILGDMRTTRNITLITFSLASR
jgi:hypothetical protein